MGLKPIDPDRLPDKMRLCPTCRMEISVLATKCRFCGEEVGRPKDEQRHFTVEDLGGETVEHYAPSSSVMEALETFRSDETVRSALKGQKKTSIFRRSAKEKAEKEAVQGLRSGLPELDAHGRALASVKPIGRQQTPGRRARGPSWTKKVGAFAVLVAAILILWFGGVKVAAVIKDFVAKDTTTNPVVQRVPNPAVAILNGEGDPLAALEAALKHRRSHDSPEARNTLERARAYTEKKVFDLLNAEPYSRDNYQRATKLVNTAHQVDPCDRFAELKATLLAEICAYRVQLKSSDTTVSPPQATLVLQDTNFIATEVTVKEGETVLDGRFKVYLIMGDEVRLTDSLRNNRKLVLRKYGELTPYTG